MDSWAGSNPGDRRHHASETETLHSVTTPQLPAHGQGQLEAQIPSISSTSRPPRHTMSPPPVVQSENEPALWQLGRHSQYLGSTEHDQKSPPSTGQSVVGYAEGDGKWDFERVQHRVDKQVEAGIQNVEADLHRALKARQVRLLSILF
jgi:hypothetical protein